MPARSGTDALVEVEEALAAVVRQVNLPRIQERLSAETGVVLDRGAIPVLRCVAAEEAVRVSDVARLVHLDPSTVSRHVKHLERLGMVARAAHHGDGRASVLRLTGEGRRVLDAVTRARRRFVAELLAGWDPDDIVTLAPLLARLARDLTTTLSGGDP